MAVYPIFKGVSVTIESDGKALQEIPNPDEIVVHHKDPDIRDWIQTRTVSNYVEVMDSAR